MPNTQSRVIRERPNMSRQTSVLEEAAREVCGKCVGSVWNVQLSLSYKGPGNGIGSSLSRKNHGTFLFPDLALEPQKKPTKSTLSFNHDALWNSTLKKKRDSHHSHSFLVVVFNFCLQVTILQALYLQNLIRIRTMPGGNEAKV